MDPIACQFQSRKVGKYYRVSPKFWRAPLAHDTPTFSCRCDLMMGIGKPQLLAKFKVGSFSHCKNVKWEPQILESSINPGQRPLFLLGKILLWALANRSCFRNVKSLSSVMTGPGYLWDRWLYFVGKLSWDITTIQVNSALRPSEVAKSSTSFGFWWFWLRTAISDLVGLSLTNCLHVCARRQDLFWIHVQCVEGGWSL